MKKVMSVIVLLMMFTFVTGAYAYTPGTYTAKTQGHAGYVTVTVTIGDDGTISEVKADGPDETPTIGGYALSDLAEEATKSKSAEVDAYTGATNTRNAFAKAFQECLDEASK